MGSSCKTSHLLSYNDEQESNNILNMKGFKYIDGQVDPAGIRILICPGVNGSGNVCCPQALCIEFGLFMSFWVFSHD